MTPERIAYAKLRVERLDIKIEVLTVAIRMLGSRRITDEEHRQMEDAIAARRSSVAARKRWLKELGESNAS